MREPNAIDFWRGFALVTIFIDHVPGNLFMRLTLHNYAICDAAELFVFLAGWALSLATGGPQAPEPRPRVVLRLFSRAVEVYRAQLVITALALAILAAAAIRLDNPLFLEWHNAGPIFYSPIYSTIGWVLMTHQLGFFNILPLYVVLLVMAPAFVILARWRLAVAMAGAIALYLGALAFKLNLPTWPYDGSWFFNPFAWQILFALGFMSAELSRSGPAFAAHMRRLVLPAWLIVLACAAVAVSGFAPDPLAVPEPKLFFLFDKSALSPARLINFIALAIAFQNVYPILARWLPWLASLLSGLGRNSLAVFSVGSIASLIGQIARFVAGGSVVMDAVIVASGVAVLAFTSWFVEWRTRFRGPSRPALS